MSRKTNGIVVVDKPSGASSARVVSEIKRLFDVRKAGHAGTLDPMATGLLVCCLNDATRLARFFLQSDKHYEAVLCLGIETDTQDRTGRVVKSIDVGAVTKAEIESALRLFTGAIQQQPPVFSALKHQGIPLYKLARSGKPVQKPPRKIVIHDLALIRAALPEILLRVRCSAGTYVRTLCADIGKALGLGGHLKELRRLESSGFSVAEAVSLPDLEKDRRHGTLDRRIVAMSDALKGMPECRADSVLADSIRHGVPLVSSDICLDGHDGHAEYIKIVDAHGHLIAVTKRRENKNEYDYCCVFPNG